MINNNEKIILYKVFNPTEKITFFFFKIWAFVGRGEWFQNKRGTNSGWLNSLWQYPVADEGDKIGICVTQRVLEKIIFQNKIKILNIRFNISNHIDICWPV